MNDGVLGIENAEAIISLLVLKDESNTQISGKTQMTTMYSMMP
jgi:hypothetical protein